MCFIFIILIYCLYLCWSMIDCIILAGGRGSRRIGYETPQALIRVKDKELIAHQIDYLKDKVRKIIVTAAYKADEVEEFLDETYPELSIVCIKENNPLGTAGALRNALDEVDSERVLVLNCDAICDINVEELQKIPQNVICVHNPKLPFGIIEKGAKEEEHYFGKFQFLERPILKGIWSSCGWYLLKKLSISHFTLKGSLEYNVFPKLQFDIYKHLGRVYTFNTMSDIEAFEKER